MSRCKWVKNAFFPLNRFGFSPEFLKLRMSADPAPILFLNLVRGQSPAISNIFQLPLSTQNPVLECRSRGLKLNIQNFFNLSARRSFPAAISDEKNPCPWLFKYDAGFTKSHGNDLWTMAKPCVKARFSFCFKYVAS